MDDFENPRVRRLRGDTFRQASKGIQVAVIRMTREEKDALYVEAEEKAIDFHRLVAARVLGVSIDKVTEADCQDAKGGLGDYTYGAKP